MSTELPEPVVPADLSPDAPASAPAELAADTLAVDSWLPLPDVAERLGTDVGRVRRMLQDRRITAARVGERRILSVPERFLVQGEDGRWDVVPALQGTLVVLGDAGYSDEEAIRWLFTADPSLAVQGWSIGRDPAPIDALAAGHKTEVRRRAQALGL